MENKTIESEDERTIFIANLSEQVTDSLLYELFFQGGPIEKVSIPKDKDGRQRTFGFVTFSHSVSAPYAVELFAGTRLFNRDLTIKIRNGPNSNNNKSFTNQYQAIRQQQQPPLPMNMNQQLHPQIMQRMQPITTNIALTTGHNPMYNASLLSVPMQPSTKVKPPNPFGGGNQPPLDLNALMLMGTKFLQSELSGETGNDVWGRSSNSAKDSKSNRKMLNKHDKRPHNNDRQYARHNSPSRRNRSPPPQSSRHDGNQRSNRDHRSDHNHGRRRR